MKRIRAATLSTFFALGGLGLLAGADWPCFRGPGGTGSASGAVTALPTEFGNEGKNVAWKVPLPGRGPSSPIVVDGRVVVTASGGPREDRLHVLAFDAETGERLWHRELWATGHTICHGFGAVAGPTPASDGRLIFAFYSSNDLACFDLEGNLKWFRGLAYEHPKARNDVGMASSPAVIRDTVIVQIENQGDSFAAGLDTATGETRWLKAREDGAIWSSPAVLPGATREQDVVLMQSRSKLTAQNAHTGEHLWEYETSCHTMSSALVAGGIVYLPSHGLHSLKPQPDGRGFERLWYEQRLSSGPSSPVAQGGRVYTLKSPGILVCGDAKTGEVLWQLRLKGPFWASARIAGGHAYCVNHAGEVQVVRLDDDKGELVATNQIDKAILASPAVADGAIYFRSDEHLWKVALDGREKGKEEGKRERIR